MIRAVLICVLGLLFHLPAVPAQDRGEEIVLGTATRLYSKVLNEERTLQIALPARYGEETTAYPVLIVLDGDTNFRFTAGIVRYLTVYNLIPGLIVAGIPNTDRNRDFLPASGSAQGQGQAGRQAPPDGTPPRQADAFLKFLEQEAIPFLDKNYRTQPFRTIAGHSLGGLLAIHALFRNPGLFSGYLAISPSLWWNNKEYVNKVQDFYRSHPVLNKTIFVTLASESEDQPDFYTQLENAFEQNQPAGTTAEFRSYRDKNHITTAVEATMDGLCAIFSSWLPPRDLLVRADLEGIRNHFRKLEKKLGFPCLPPEGSINEAGYNHLRMNQLDRALALFRFNVELHPGSANVYDSLAEAYVKAGEKELAIQNYEKSLQLNPKNTNAARQLQQMKAK